MQSQAKDDCGKLKALHQPFIIISSMFYIFMTKLRRYFIIMCTLGDSHLYAILLGSADIYHLSE